MYVLCASQNVRSSPWNPNGVSVLQRVVHNMQVCAHVRGPSTDVTFGVCHTQTISAATSFSNTGRRTRAFILSTAEKKTHRLFAHKQAGKVEIERKAGTR